MFKKIFWWSWSVNYIVQVFLCKKSISSNERPRSMGEKRTLRYQSSFLWKEIMYVLIEFSMQSILFVHSSSYCMNWLGQAAFFRFSQRYHGTWTNITFRIKLIFLVVLVDVVLEDFNQSVVTIASIKPAMNAPNKRPFKQGDRYAQSFLDTICLNPLQYFV